MSIENLKKTKRKSNQAMRAFSSTNEVNNILDSLAKRNYNISAVIREAIIEFYKNNLKEVTDGK